MKIIVYCCLITIVSAGSNQPAPVVETCVKPNLVALTFDDGPSPNYPQLVQTLKQKNVVATAFVNFRDQVNWNATIRSAFYSGVLQIQNHGYYHKDMTSLSDYDQLMNINMGDKLIREAIGRKPNFFRPPFGLYDVFTQKAATALGYKALIKWNSNRLDCGDSNCVNDFKDHYENQRLPSSFILLMHNKTPGLITNVLPKAIDYFRSKNYRFVTISECLGVSAYQ